MLQITTLGGTKLEVPKDRATYLYDVYDIWASMDEGTESACSWWSKVLDAAQEYIDLYADPAMDANDVREVAVQS